MSVDCTALLNQRHFDDPSAEDGTLSLSPALSLSPSLSVCLTLSGSVCAHGRAAELDDGVPPRPAGNDVF